jgi:hypothetical protein
MAGDVVKSGAVLRWKASGDLTVNGSKSATVPSVETLATIVKSKTPQNQFPYIRTFN